jgi:hypothetical protein
MKAFDLLLSICGSLALVVFVLHKEIQFRKNR